MGTIISPASPHSDVLSLISMAPTNTPNCRNTSFQIDLDTASIGIDGKACLDRPDDQPPQSLQKSIARLARVR